jgi:hypothetical protein
MSCGSGPLRQSVEASWSQIEPRKKFSISTQPTNTDDVAVTTDDGNAQLPTEFVDPAEYSRPQFLRQSA